MQVLSYHTVCVCTVYSSKTYEEDLTEDKEAPNHPINEDSCFQQYSGAKEGRTARFKRAQRVKVGSGDIVTVWKWNGRRRRGNVLCHRCFVHCLQ